jgi:hypothetical protein
MNGTWAPGSSRKLPVRHCSLQQSRENCVRGVWILLNVWGLRSTNVRHETRMNGSNSHTCWNPSSTRIAIQIDSQGHDPLKIRCFIILRPDWPPTIDKLRKKFVYWSSPKRSKDYWMLSIKLLDSYGDKSMLSVEPREAGCFKSTS